MIKLREEARSPLASFHAGPLSWSNCNLSKSWDSEVSEPGPWIKHYLKDCYELENFKHLLEMNRVFSKVYGTELEKVEVFNGFQDFVETFYIHRGKVKSKSEEEETIVGEFKASKVRILESVLKHLYGY